MAIFVKICGLSSSDAVAGAVAAGADALGFVFAPSPRRVTPEAARQLCGQVPVHIRRVAVMKRPSAEEWQAVAEGLSPDWLQADAQALAGLPVGRTVPVPVFRDGEDHSAIQTGDLLLFEGAASGQGIRADWSSAAPLARRTRLILAGGLTPENVAEAIRQVRPWGVDVSSGVESSRGVKDPQRIAAFVAAVRKAEHDHGN